TDRLFGEHVADGTVLLGPAHGGIEVGCVEELTELVEVGLPSEAGGRRDEADAAAAGQHVGGEHAVDQVAVPDEVDALDAGRPVGDAGTREEGVHGPAARVDGFVDRRLVGEVGVDGGDARRRDIGEIHHHDVGTRVP